MGRPISTEKSAEERLAHIRAVNSRNARNYRQKNPLKVARNSLRYWQRKVEQLEAAENQRDKGD